MIILNKTVWAEDKIAGMRLDGDTVILHYPNHENETDIIFDTDKEAEDAFKQAVIKFKEYTERVR